MRTTIDLPEPLFRSAKRRAAERKVTLSAVVRDALVADLVPKPAVPAPPFRLVTVKGKPLSGIDLERTSEFIQADDIAAFQALDTRRKSRNRKA